MCKKCTNCKKQEDPCEEGNIDAAEDEIMQEDEPYKDYNVDVIPDHFD